MIHSQFATRMTIYGDRNYDNRKSRRHKPTKFKPSAKQLRHAFRYFTDCGEVSRAEAARDALLEDYGIRLAE